MSGRAVDRLLAAFVAVGGCFELALIDPRGPLVANVACVLTVGAMITQRRRHPLAVALVTLVVLALMSAELTPVDEFVWPFFPLLLAAFGCGAFAAGWRAYAGLAAGPLTVTAVNVAQGSTLVGDFVFPSVFAICAWVTGRVVRARSMLAAELHEAAVRAEDEREAEAAQAVADERRRIAREMHDVVAHSMSVMVVQAGGARRILDRDPARAVAAAEQIERTGREALTEMRRLLGVLGTSDARTPQPGLDGLETLVTRARDAGLPVTLDVAGSRTSLPAGLELAAYRIVQEGLTNALKHAGTVPTQVCVRYERDRVELVIDNDRPLAPVATNGSPGHGLIGMRERVRVFDGELSARERLDGGFTVRATLPLPDVTTA